MQLSPPQPRYQRRHQARLLVPGILCLLLATLAACGARSVSEGGESTPTADSAPTQANSLAPGGYPLPPGSPAPEANPVPPSYPIPSTPFAGQAAAYPPPVTVVVPTFAPTPTFMPPPTPATPIAQALMGIGPHALLYNLLGSQLMLADLTHAQQLWVTALDDDTCRSPYGYPVQSGIWSADGRFLSVICQVGNDSGSTHPTLIAYLFDRTTGIVQQLVPTDRNGAQEVLQPEAWAPSDDRLLVQEYSQLTGTVHWSIINALTGARTPLIDTTNTHGVPPHSAIWSPDGRQIALLNDNGTYIVQADSSGFQTYKEPSPPLAFDLLWSPDGQFLYFGNSGVDPHIPAKGARLNIATGQVEMLPGTPAIAFSPDGTHYLAKELIEPHDEQWVVWSLQGFYRLFSAIGNAAWLPNGRLVATMCGRDYSVSSKPAQIVLFTMDGTMETIAKADTCVNLYPSPDGALIALSNGQVIDLQGKQQAKLPGWVGDQDTLPHDVWFPIP
jgi:hypothetical protein